MALKENEFRCTHCGGVFLKGWSEEEARKEAEQWGDELEEQGEAVVCDPCYQEFMRWYNGT